MRIESSAENSAESIPHVISQLQSAQKWLNNLYE